jgi:predicted metalloenzyme YecM
MSNEAELADQLDVELGGAREFFADVLARVLAGGPDASAMPVSHLCYRVSTLGEYARARARLLPFCESSSENLFNGRPVSMLALARPFALSGSRSVSLIELPAPRGAHPYATGLEHAGFVVAGDFAAFGERWSEWFDGRKDRGKLCQPLIKTFANGRSAKFYERPLREVIEFEGGKFVVRA